VLEKMKEYSYITDEQYRSSVNYKIFLTLSK